jgi:hypothetical protein
LPFFLGLFFQISCNPNLFIKDIVLLLCLRENKICYFFLVFDSGRFGFLILQLRACKNVVALTHENQNKQSQDWFNPVSWIKVVNHCSISEI